MKNISCGIFYVRVRKDYEQARRDYFPYIHASYLKISKSFIKDKPYPVLAIKHATLFAEDQHNIETSQFLVPTENGNFLWIQSEIFEFAGIQPEGIDSNVLEAVES